jgi:hypothetical protein
MSVITRVSTDPVSYKNLPYDRLVQLTTPLLFPLGDVVSFTVELFFRSVRMQTQKAKPRSAFRFFNSFCSVVRTKQRLSYDTAGFPTANYHGIYMSSQ